MPSIMISGKALIGFIGPSPSLRGAKRRGNPAAQATRMLRFARNDDGYCSCQRLVDRGGDFGDLEGLATNLVERARVDEEGVAEHGLQLPEV